MKNAYRTLGTVGSIIAAGYFSLAPVDADAFYVSDKEAQKAGVSRKDVTGDKQPMGDSFSYKGHLEGDETFNEIARRVNNWAEDFFGAELSEEITFDVLKEFNSYRKVEMPAVSTPCKYQFMMNYVKQMEKQRGKAEFDESKLDFLKLQMHKLQETYESELTDLKAKYNGHEKRIKELEERPEQQDYSGEIDELRKENEELRKMIGSMEGGYGQPVQGGGTAVVYVQPGWFVGVPYPAIIWNGGIYYREYIGSTFFWRRWGWLDFYDGYYYARGLNGGVHYYHGPASYVPRLKHHWERRRHDGRPGKHPGDQHRRDPRRPGPGREHPGDRGRRFEEKGRRDIPRSELPRAPRTFDRRQEQQRPHQGIQRGPQTNPQFNQRQMRPSVPQGGGSRGGSFTAPQRSFGNQGFQQGGANIHGGAKVTPQAPGNQIRGRGPR